jgi:hypothetical protein
MAVFISATAWADHDSRIGIVSRGWAADGAE